MVFLPSLKKAIASISLSSASGAMSVVWMIRDTVPASPKNRYMVECCQFIRSSQCFSATLYNWSLGPSANCSASIPGQHSTIFSVQMIYIFFLFSRFMQKCPQSNYEHRDLQTNNREEEHNRAFNDLQAALWSFTGQSTGADVLVPAGGVPERVLSCPPDSSYQEEASWECMALEASHDLHYVGGNKSVSGYG